jgi:glutamate dehydrogenase
MRDDLYSLHRALTVEVSMESAKADSPNSRNPDAAIDAWVDANADAVERSRAMLGDIRATRVFDLTTLPVALREVRNLLQEAVADSTAR